MVKRANVWQSLKSVVRRATGANLRLDPAWAAFVAALEPNLFLGGEDMTEQDRRMLFKRHVRLVEIEPHAYCNRTCSFCPNSIIDRRTPKEVFDPILLESILRDLAAIDFDQGLRFARYSEPLAYESIFSAISLARRYLPEAYIDVISNGDYLTPDRLSRLVTAGLSCLRISVYLKDGVRWTPESALSETKRIFARAGLECTVEVSTQHTLLTKASGAPIEIYSSSHNFSEVGNDRGQSLPHLTKKEYVRRAPCRMVFTNFTVDYDGIVMPCCNLRGDDPDHEEFKIGNLKDGLSIFDIYAGRAFAAWRRGLWNVGEKTGPCATCNQKDAPESTLSLLDQAIRRKGIQPT